MDQMQEAFFEQLYKNWFPKLFHYISAAVSDPHAAEEIVQDTFLSALGKLDLLAQAEHPERWLLKKAKNKTLHYFRDQATRRDRLRTLDDQVLPACPNQAITALEEGHQESLAQTHAVIRQTLRPEELSLLRQIALEGKSYQETAASLGCSLWACQKRMQRIRQKLRTALAGRDAAGATPSPPPERREGQDALWYFTPQKEPD